MEETSNTVHVMEQTIEDKTLLFNNDDRSNLQKNLTKTESDSIQDKIKEKIIYDIVQETKKCDSIAIDNKDSVEHLALCIPEKISVTYNIDKSDLGKHRKVSHENISDCNNDNHSNNTESSSDAIEICPENGEINKNNIDAAQTVQSSNLTNNGTSLKNYDSNLENTTSQNNSEISKLETSSDIQNSANNAEVNDLFKVVKFVATGDSCLSDNKISKSDASPEESSLLIAPKEKFLKNLFELDKSIETETSNYSCTDENALLNDDYIEINSSKDACPMENTFECSQNLNSPTFKSMNNEDLASGKISSLVRDAATNRVQSNIEDKEVERVKSNSEGKEVKTLNENNYSHQSAKIPLQLKSNKKISTESFKLKPCCVNLTKVSIAESSSLFNSKPCLAMLKRRLEEMLHDSTKQEDSGIKEIKKMRQERSRAYGNLLKELTRVKNKIKTIK